MVAALGVALAADLLASRRMPTGYAAARMAAFRRDYLLPRTSFGHVPLQDYQFAVVEDGAEAGTPDFSENGLVVGLSGGVMIRAGQQSGDAGVHLMISEGEPELDLAGWQDVVDVSWTATAGHATAAGLHDGTHPWPGSFRARVSASGRDDERSNFRIEVWPAPAAAPVNHRLSDRCGHRLRGEKVPDLPPAVEHCGWVRRSVLEQAATITVAVGLSRGAVLKGFGAEGRAIPIDRPDEEYREPMPVSVIAVSGGMIAVENNGWQGSRSPVLRRLSRSGTAGSVYWNVNRGATLSLARDGVVLGTMELGIDDFPEDPVFRSLLDGIDFDDYLTLTAQALFALEVFTGVHIREDLIPIVEQDGRAYRIRPWLEDFYPASRGSAGEPLNFGGGDLEDVTEILGALDDSTLHDLAWDAARAVADSYGAVGDLLVDQVLADRRFDAATERAARGGWGDDYPYSLVLSRLHGATNPDGLAALISQVRQLSWLQGPAHSVAAEQIRQQIRDAAAG